MHWIRRSGVIDWENVTRNSRGLAWGLGSRSRLARLREAALGSLDTPTLLRCLRSSSRHDICARSYTNLHLLRFLPRISRASHAHAQTEIAVEKVGTTTSLLGEASEMDGECHRK
jgi:hypothetical protein